MTDWAPWLGAWAGSSLPGGADAPQATFVVGAVFVAYLVLDTAGFGSALVAVPLLAWVWPLALVVPLLLLIDVPASLLLPVAVLAVVLGHRLAHRLPAARLVPLIHELLVASGLVLALRTLRALV